MINRLKDLVVITREATKEWEIKETVETVTKVTQDSAVTMLGETKGSTMI